ncbi:hypothetical protein [Thermovibrio sp.]
MSDGIEERLRKLELSYTEIKSKMITISGDIKDIKETLKELAEIAKAQIRIDTQIKSFIAEREAMVERIEKLEAEVQALKRIAYGAVAIATIAAPVAMEVFKHLLK